MRLAKKGGWHSKGREANAEIVKGIGQGEEDFEVFFSECLSLSLSQTNWQLFFCCDLMRERNLIREK